MLKLASAEADITPPVGIDLSGFALRKNPATEVHDPLKIRWLALSDAQGSRLLLGSADVLSFSRQTYQTLRDDIRSALGGNSKTHVALATTHTHSGPATVRLRHCGKMNLPYLQSMKRRIVESAVAAVQAPARAVKVIAGSVDCHQNINRRSGESGSNDPRVQILQFLTNDAIAQPLATLVNYACHPVVLGHENRGISADYPGYACAHVEAETGAPCLFLNGACGDINPRDPHHAEPSYARNMGNSIVECIGKALKSAAPAEVNHIEWRQQRVKLPVKIPKSPAEIKNRITQVQERFGLPQQLFAGRLKRDLKMLKHGTYPQNITIEISLLALTPHIAILFVPGELFSSIGLRAQAIAAPRQLLVSGFSNGSVGYLCDRQAFADGGYEPCFANLFYDFPEFHPDLEDYLLSGIDRLLNPKTSGF